jgi:hypothetical protein
MPAPHKQKSSVVFLSHSGCLLPFLLFFNFFFGWLFLKPFIWLGVEAGLVILLILNSYILAKKLFNYGPGTNRGKVIDTEAEVVEDQR